MFYLFSIKHFLIDSPRNLRFQRYASLHSCQTATPLSEVIQHNFTEPVVHVDLLVVDESCRFEVRSEPLQQIVAIRQLDVHQHTFGQEDCRDAKVHLGLLQFDGHLVDVAQIDSDYVIIG